MSNNANYRTQRLRVRACLRQRHGFPHRNWMSNSGLAEGSADRAHTPRRVEDVKPSVAGTVGPLANKRDH